MTRGLEDFTLDTEQYYLHVDPAVEVLATTEMVAPDHPWLRGVTMPVVWTRSWGEGRVFYCAIGHGCRELVLAPVRELVLRGIAWAARSEP